MPVTPVLPVPTSSPPDVWGATLNTAITAVATAANANETAVAAKADAAATTTALAGKAPTTRTVTAGTGLTGGGDLTADRTVALTAGAQTSLALADTAVQPARTITAGTGLTGGGTLAADRTLAVTYGTTAGTAAQGNDLRLTGGHDFSAVGVLQVSAAASGRKYNNTGGTRTLTLVQVSVGTAPAGSGVTVDVRKGGTTILTTPVTIPAGQQYATATPTVTAWAAGEYLEIWITAVGSTTPGSDLTGEVVYQ